MLPCQPAIPAIRFRGDVIHFLMLPCLNEKYWRRLLRTPPPHPLSLSTATATATDQLFDVGESQLITGTSHSNACVYFSSLISQEIKRKLTKREPKIPNLFQIFPSTPKHSLPLPPIFPPKAIYGRVNIRIPQTIG